MYLELPKDDEIVTIKTFVPDKYQEYVSDSSDIPNGFSNKPGIYRFYGIFNDAGQIIGYIKYCVSFNSPIAEIAVANVEAQYRGNGYGSLLIQQSILDLAKDFPYIDHIIVLSTPEAISFYQRNDFEPYFGDNNLTRNLHNKNIDFTLL